MLFLLFFVLKKNILSLYCTCTVRKIVYALNQALFMSLSAMLLLLIVGN